MGQSLTSVQAASFEGTGRRKHKFPVPSDDEDQLPPMSHSQQPLPPPPAEPSLGEPTPTSAQTAPTQPSSVPGSSDAVTTQPDLSENEKLNISGENMNPTKVDTIGQLDTVKHDQGDDVTRVPVGRGALRKVYNILKEVAFSERSEVRKLPSVFSEHGQNLSDDNLRQTDLENRFKPKRAVFLRGAKRGAPDIFPKQSVTEPKRGAVWPSRARPHRTQTVITFGKQSAESLTSTALKTTEKCMGEPLPTVPEVDVNGNTSAISCSDLAPPSVWVNDGRKSPEEIPKNYSILRGGIQLERKLTESSCSSLEEKKFLSDLEKARQLSLKENWPPGTKKGASCSVAQESVEKEKGDLEESEDEKFQRDLGEACKRSLLENWSSELLELDEDPEATVSPLQSDEEQGAPMAEALYRYLNEPYQQHKPLDLKKVTTTVSSVDSKKQTPDEQGGLHSPQHDKHQSLSPQPGPSSSQAVNIQGEKTTLVFPLTEEQQFLRDMEMARQLSIKENWKHGMGVGDSSDED